jgi:hypothetical protein
MKEWSHLPNAHHIDWVLASLKENPEFWSAAWGGAWDAARAAAWDAAWDATWSAARGAAWSAAWDAARSAARGAARAAASVAAGDAISALVAYDDCDQFLSMSYERLKVWAILSEDPRAVLLLPMIYVREKLNEQCMVTPA